MILIWHDYVILILILTHILPPLKASCHCYFHVIYTNSDTSLHTLILALSGKIVLRVL